MKQKYIKPIEIALQLGTPYPKILEFLNQGIIPAKKIKGRWRITQNQLSKFIANNKKAIDRLKAEYVELYRGGISHYRLQKKVIQDFSNKHILAKTSGFAEITIYEFLKRGGNH